jgi:hypothetical protein
VEELKDLASPKIGVGDHDGRSGPRDLSSQKSDRFVALATVKPGLLVLLGSGLSDAALLSLDHFDNRIVPLFANIDRNFGRVFGDLVTIRWATRRLCPRNLNPNPAARHAERNLYGTNDWKRLLVSDDPLNGV